MKKALVVDVIISEKDYDTVFKKVFGVTSRTSLAERAMRNLNGYLFLCPEGDYIYGSSSTKEKLKEFNTIVYLSQIFNNYNIGSL